MGGWAYSTNLLLAFLLVVTVERMSNLSPQQNYDQQLCPDRENTWPQHKLLPSHPTPPLAPICYGLALFILDQLSVCPLLPPPPLPALPAPPNFLVMMSLTQFDGRTHKSHHLPTICVASFVLSVLRVLRRPCAAG